MTNPRRWREGDSPQAAFIKAYPKLDDALNKQAWALTAPRLSSDPPAVDAGQYVTFAAFMNSKGLIDDVEPVSRYIGMP